MEFTELIFYHPGFGIFALGKEKTGYKRVESVSCQMKNQNSSKPLIIYTSS